MTDQQLLPRSGKSLLVTGIGYFHLPASLADLEQWRQEHPGASVLADLMADAIVTGNGVVDDADIGHTVIIHWPDGKTSVVHAAELAAACGVTEADVREALDQLADRGLLEPCDPDDDDSCGDGGYRATVPPGAVFNMLFDDIAKASLAELGAADDNAQADDETVQTSDGNDTMKGTTP